jgi:uncharacterized membrane protein
MNYFELSIAILVTICTSLLFVNSINVESPIKTAWMVFLLLMLAACLRAVYEVCKEMKRERREGELR